MVYVLHGIPNCDTVRKARVWLRDHDVSYRFHDYKTAGIEAETLQCWMDEHGWEVLLNRAGTTFRNLPEADRQDMDHARAKTLMLAQPSMIKRPVLDLGGRTVVGFKPEVYAEAVGR